MIGVHVIFEFVTVMTLNIIINIQNKRFLLINLNLIDLITNRHITLFFSIYRCIMINLKILQYMSVLNFNASKFKFTWNKPFSVSVMFRFTVFRPSLRNLCHFRVPDHLKHVLYAVLRYCHSSVFVVGGKRFLRTHDSLTNENSY